MVGAGGGGNCGMRRRRLSGSAASAAVTASGVPAWVAGTAPDGSGLGAEALVAGGVAGPAGEWPPALQPAIRDTSAPVATARNNLLVAMLCVLAVGESSDLRR
ncbi:hypothetical protein GCM10023107_58530 [Actinoplanes octamycinicus]|nr:hypothetical protein Aoc01nite_84890 [Actinoplanes octamycinicus]